MASPESDDGSVRKAALEGALARHYGAARLHIRPGDDLDQACQTIMEGDLGDFCWSLDFQAEFVVRLLSHGFLPICSRLATGPPPDDGGAPPHIFVLLPKLHRQRCLLRCLNTLKVDRGARKKSRRYRLTADTAFHDVVQGCIEQHGESWLWPPMRDTLASIFQSQHGGRSAESQAGAAQLHSIELWADDGQLAAGELGYMCGTMYTSLTGFYRQGGAGTVQVLALAGLLISSGCPCWDLGMVMEYKARIGGEVVGRPDFVALQRHHRSSSTVELAPAGRESRDEGWPAQDLIGRISHAEAAAQSDRGPGE